MGAAVRGKHITVWAPSFPDPLSQPALLGRQRVQLELPWVYVKSGERLRLSGRGNALSTGFLGLDWITTLPGAYSRRGRG